MCTPSLTSHLVNIGLLFKDLSLIYSRANLFTFGFLGTIGWFYLLVFAPWFRETFGSNYLIYLCQGTRSSVSPFSDEDGQFYLSPVLKPHVLWRDTPGNQGVLLAFYWGYIQGKQHWLLKRPRVGSPCMCSIDYTKFLQIIHLVCTQGAQLVLLHLFFIPPTAFFKEYGVCKTFLVCTD